MQCFNIASKLTAYFIAQNVGLFGYLCCSQLFCLSMCARCGHEKPYSLCFPSKYCSNNLATYFPKTSNSMLITVPSLKLWKLVRL